MDTCRLVAQKRSNKRTEDTEGDQLNANQVKHHQTTLDSLTSFHKAFMWFSLPLFCHKRPHTMQTDKNLYPRLTVSATTFLLACLSQNGQACFHKHSQTLILLIPSFKTWLSTLNQRKLNKKDTRKVDFFRNKSKQHHCEKNA